VFILYCAIHSLIYYICGLYKLMQPLVFRNVLFINIMNNVDWSILEYRCKQKSWCQKHHHGF